MQPYTELWYQSNDNLKLYARDYPNPDARLTLLCMHGLTRNSADFEEMCEHLHPDYRLVVPDQRGRGNSAYDPNPGNYHPGTYAQDMFTLIDRYQLTNLVLIGTSMGGLMAMIMNALRPGTFRGIVLNDIGPEVDPAGLERIKGYVGKTAGVSNWADAVDMVRDTNGDAFPRYQDEDWQRLARKIYREDEAGVPRLRYDVAIAQPIDQDDGSATPDLWPVFSALTPVPTMVMRGALSDILSLSTVKEMQARKPDLVTVEIADVGHAPTLSEPEAIAALSQFLSRL